MGDEDDIYTVDKIDATALNAMANLLAMTNKIKNDGSEYYEAPPTLDETLRDNVPALKDAWDQYQIILRFAKEEHYAKEENNGR